VKAFWDALTELSSESNSSLEKAGAMAVGRFRDGTPLVPSLTPDPEADPNDFHYGLQDRDGAQCPFHAHIRKTNPRGDLPDSDLERAKRIVRRGITYDDRSDGDSSTATPSKGVGLLFMCFQANLDQFVIQQEGSDGNDFARIGTGFDAVIGQYHGTGPEPVEQTWPSTGDVKFKMVNFVRMRGGEYFFAPSMTFLKGLSQV
jgi:deferrochelatase/peroxidase EfeB